LNLVWLYQLGYTMTSVLAFWLIIKGIKYAEASIGGLVGLLEIVFSVLSGILFFKEILTLKVIIGAILIISAAALPHLNELRQNYVKNAPGGI
ncbi:MAG TPA: EamA family transporter, partial [Candidatus Nanoarchaeia archaeon]|nr:EamA family transporter [Candidatus Nanoarchaeia archaeon]